MVEIGLTQNKKTIIDDDIAPLISKYKWCVVNRGGRLYAERAIRINGKSKEIYLHHVIAGKPIKKGFVIDHIDGNGLNNRRDNLRIVSHRVNCLNRSNRLNLIGACFNKARGYWYSMISLNGKSKYLGKFSSEQDASNAYQHLLKQLNLNGID